VEVGVGPEFSAWLTDPAKIGAGATFDFGCYGRNFETWPFGNARPVSVLAATRTNKLKPYPKVDDEATMVMQCASAQVIVQPSRNWPFSRKDMEVHGEKGYVVAADPRRCRFREGSM
jgi:predicted dehydrogenase